MVDLVVPIQARSGAISYRVGRIDEERRARIVFELSHRLQGILADDDAAALRSDCFQPPDHGPGPEGLAQVRLRPHPARRRAAPTETRS